MKKILTVTAVILSAAIVFSGCFADKDSKPSNDSKDEKTATMQTVKSSKTDLTIDVPEGWKKNTSSENSADTSISMMSKKDDIALIVIEEKAGDLAKGLTLDKYSDMLVQVMQNTKGSSDWKIDALKDTKIGDGIAAKQRTISVTVNGVNLKYLQTVFKEGDDFAEILEWTTPSKFDGYTKTFGEILKTVQF